MEQTPLNTPEDNSSDKDDDKLAKKKKKSKVAGSMPLGLQIQAEETSTDQPKPALSISEHFMQQMEERAAKVADAKEKDSKSDETKETDDDKKQEKDDTSEPEPATLAQSDTVESLAPTASIEHEDTDSSVQLEAADWESEGEFNEDGHEIQLNQKSTDTPAANKPEIPEFVEVPVEAEEVPDNAETEPAEPELLETGLASEQPPEQPIDSVAETNVPESIRSRVSDETGSPWYDAVAVDRTARQQRKEVNAPAYYSEKRGHRPGLGGISLFNRLFGRHGKDKATAELQKAMKQKDKEIVELSDEQILAKQRIEAIKRTQEQMQSNIQQEGVKSSTELRNVSKQAAEIAKAQEFSKKAGFERLSAVEKPKNAEKQPSKELPPIEKDITEDYKVPEGRRVETSAWHRIEIDQKTGKAVNNPEIAYGKEFEREQKQEVKHDDPAADDTPTSAFALGGLATSSAATNSNKTTNSSIYQDSVNNDLQVPKPKDANAHLTAGNDVLRYASKPLIWVIAIIVVVVLFLIGALR